MIKNTFFKHNYLLLDSCLLWKNLELKMPLVLEIGKGGRLATLKILAVVDVKLNSKDRSRSLLSVLGELPNYVLNGNNLCKYCLLGFTSQSLT